MAPEHVVRPPLGESDPMPFGPFKGKPMAQVPRPHLRELFLQPWLMDWPQLFAYCKLHKSELEASYKQDAPPDEMRTYEDFKRNK